MEIKHSDRDHAILSASGSHRWLNCTPSAKLEAEYGKKGDTEFAQEGTLAHELGEILLRHELGIIDDTTNHAIHSNFDLDIAELKQSRFYTSEMDRYVRDYADYCKQQFVAARTFDKGATYSIELKLDLSCFVLGSFGTADFVVIGDGILEVIDLKYGAGVAVSAYNNPQLMLYALGALKMHDSIYDIDKVRMTIVQPRMDNISTFEMSVEELNGWANNELKPKADMAIKGEGELHCGKWCQFCKVRERCRELYNVNMRVINNIKNKSFDLLTDDEIADVVSSESQISTWLKAICEYAKNQAIEGHKFKGLKLVEGRSIRKWRSESVGADIIARTGLTEDDIYNKKLKGIGDMEKLVGKSKFTELLGEFVVKPAGAPTLVSEDDKRPEIGKSQVLNDFGIE